jgi:integrase
VLDAIPQRSPIILTNSLLRAWTANSFGSAFNRARESANMAGADLQFHDLRGTAATLFYLSGISEREVAEIVGWEEATVSKIIRRYVAHNTAVKNLIQRIDRRRTKGDDGL